LISKRIEAIVSFIDIDDLIVDVGCDHAYVSKLLAKRGQKSIASDIVEGIIEKRKKENNELIEYYVSDGLRDIHVKYDYPVICGMGTFTILNIIKESKKDFNKCLISSNNDNELLRREMNNLGFVVEKELVIKDKNKFYNIIMFKKGKYNYTDKELYLGINHLDYEMFEEKKKSLLKKYKKIINNIPVEKRDEIKRKIDFLMN